MGSGYTIVPVCVEDDSSVVLSNDGAALSDPNPSLETVVGKVRGALSRTWERHSSVRFVGWQKCSQLTGTQPSEFVHLYIHPGAGNASQIGTDSKGAKTHFEPWGPGFDKNKCIEYNPTRAVSEYRFSCVEQFAIHEFGHAIGLLHEWQHPAKPNSCDVQSASEVPLSILPNPQSPLYTTRAYIIPNDVFDPESIMTYENPGCANVTGERFGSPEPDEWDYKAVALAYPPLAGHDYDVGVIPDIAGSCPWPTEVKFHLDNEDDDNKNRADGWIGAIKSDRNTLFEFCKVDGTRFARLAAPSSGSNNYAVLKLGTSCPSGSYEIIRRHDDQDKDFRANAANENWLAGDTGPNKQGSLTIKYHDPDPEDTYTELHWCVFEQTGQASAPRAMPNLAFRYGVLANQNFSQAEKTGMIYTDDEDDNNTNALTDGTGGPIEAQRLAVVNTFLTADNDTNYFLALVLADSTPPNASPVLAPAANSAGWNNSDVTVSWNWADNAGGAGIDSASCTTSSVLSGQGSLSASANCKDLAGNVGSANYAVKIDKTPPTITIVQPAATEYVRSTTLTLNYLVTDSGSGVETVTPTLDGSAAVGGHGLSSGQTINLLTSLPLGTHTFTINAVDKVGNASPPSLVKFTIIATPESMVQDLAQFQASGALREQGNSLVAQLENALDKQKRGNCLAARNMYGAFINTVQAQIGKSITPTAAAILIADAQYLIAHCP